MWALREPEKPTNLERKSRQSPNFGFYGDATTSAVWTKLGWPHELDDFINCAKYGLDRLRGFYSATGQSALPGLNVFVLNTVWNAIVLTRDFWQLIRALRFTGASRTWFLPFIRKIVNYLLNNMDISSTASQRQTYLFSETLLFCLLFWMLKNWMPEKKQKNMKNSRQYITLTCQTIASWLDWILSVHTPFGLRNGTVGGVRHGILVVALRSLIPTLLDARTWNEYEAPGTSRTRANNWLRLVRGPSRYLAIVPLAGGSCSPSNRVML